MLRIVEGGFNSLLDVRTEELIKHSVARGARALFIVPEQGTLTVEKWAAKNLPANAPLTFEVTNFTRLADTAFRALGGLSLERLTAGKRALVMWRVLSELSESLAITSYGAEVNAATVEKELRALGEAEALGITPEELSELAQSAVGEGRLRAKLSDLSSVMSLYRRMLGERYTDASRELSLLLEKLRAHPDYLSGAEIFIKDFTSFTEEQYRIISELSGRAEVTVFLRLARGGRELFEYGEIKRTRDRLIHDAAIAKIKTELEKAEVNANSQKPLLDDALSLLWRSNGKIDNSYLQNTDTLRVFEARDIYEECDFVLSDIARRVMAGARYSDFAVLTRSTDAYADTLLRAADAAGVPLFISKRREVSSFEAIKLIYTAFSVALSGFSRRDVITYAKCSLSGVERARCDELELYTEKWQITGKRFTDGVLWNMNPDGYTDRYRDGSEQLLLRINETRTALISPLLNFYERLAEGRTARDYALALAEFLIRIGLENSLKVRCEELLRLGESTAAEETRGLWQLICSSLDSIVEVMGDLAVSTHSFVEILKIAFGAADIGRIPAFSDEVLAGGADMLRPSGKKHIYLLGVNYGAFPYSGKSESYFTERDRAVLRSLGVAIEPEDEINAARELFVFSRSFAAASESVTLTYPLQDGAFKPLVRADVIQRLSDISDKKIAPIRISSLPASERSVTPEAALSLIDEAGDETESIKEALRQAGYSDRLRASEGKVVNDTLRLSAIGTGALYKSDLALTQMRIDTFVSCPLGYFCRYNLSLSENERAEFGAMNIGTFIHAILEEFFVCVKKLGVPIGEVKDEEKRKIVETVSKKHLERVGGAELRQTRLSVMTARLIRAAMPVVDSLCREFSSCGFEPRFFELKIGDENEALPTPASFEIPGGTARVFGTIDRVDTFKSGDNVFVRVVDYKTGRKDFSPSDIEEGRNLQMFLYLKSIVDTEKKGFKHEMGVTGDGRLIPAAIVYTRASISDVKLDAPSAEAESEALAAAQTVSGMMLKDEAAIGAMNPDFLPVKTKNGVPLENDGRLFTLDGWEELSRTLGEVVTRVATEIKSGDIAARPAKQKGGRVQCEYCAYKPICRSSFTN